MGGDVALMLNQEFNYQLKQLCYEKLSFINKLFN